MGTVQSWTRGPFDDREELPLLGTACGNPKPPQLTLSIDLPIPPFFVPKFHVPVEVPGNLLLSSVGTAVKGKTETGMRDTNFPYSSTYNDLHTCLF